MINVSKYVLPGAFMKFASEAVSAGENNKGEYYITDPINALVADGTSLQVIEAEGEFLDSGTLESWVRANYWLLDN
jgi:dTDP-glucose pyrophosphorylase